MKIINKILNLNTKKFIIFSFSISLLFSTLFSILYNICNLGNDSFLNELLDNNVFVIFGLVVILAPIIETVVFQFILIEISEALFKNPFISIIISGSIFGFSHTFNSLCLYETLGALISGLLWASLYLLAKKKEGISPFLLIFLIHAFENFIGFIINVVI